jgi:hypothetical protein
MLAITLYYLDLLGMLMGRPREVGTGDEIIPLAISHRQQRWLCFFNQVRHPNML